MKYQLTVTRRRIPTVKFFSNRKEAVKAYHQVKNLGPCCYKSLTRQYPSYGKIRVEKYREYKNECNNNIKTFVFAYNCEKEEDIKW
jgi:hypothetical protein